MSTNGITTATSATVDTRPAPEQLTLLSTNEVPLQFRIDERTRRSGLAHVAALRAQLAAQAAQRHLSAEGKRTRSVRRQLAA